MGHFVSFIVGMYFLAQYRTSIFAQNDDSVILLHANMYVFTKTALRLCNLATSVAMPNDRVEYVKNKQL